MRLRSFIFFLVPVLLVALIVLHSCKKELPPPKNPYSSINRNDTASNNISLDSLNIAYVHKKVLSVRCALNGCHDGHFEPDYRTPQSAFATLVYAPIVKNDTAHRYKYRVIPYDTTHSVLYQRITNCCFVNVNDRMPQDNIGVPLPDSSINLIARWIMHGARDMFGNVAKMPNQPPVIQGYVAVSSNYITAYSNNRHDSLFYNPFLVPDSTTSMYVGIVVTDDSTPVGNLLVNQLKISTKADDFSNASVYTATFINTGSNPIWVATVNTSSFTPNDTMYMRYYVNDGSHTANTEFPRTDLIYPYKTWWSFIRQ